MVAARFARRPEGKAFRYGRMLNGFAVQLRCGLPE